jgi:chromosome segregation ATPase
MALLLNDAAVPDEALDFLTSLEERIAHAVESVNTLRAENRALHEQLDGERAANQAAAAQVSQLHEELRLSQERQTAADQNLEHLRRARGEMKERIERLLSQLKTLSQ